MNNVQVIKNWEAGIKGKTGSLSTDGSNLFSYHQLIGYTTQKGSEKILADATDKGGKYGIGKTTSKHVGLARENTSASVSRTLNYDDFIVELIKELKGRDY